VKLPPAETSATGLALGAVGLTSTIGQLLLLRELIAVFNGNELVLSLILAVWLILVAGGTWLTTAARKGNQQRAAGNHRGLPLQPAGLVAMAAALPAQLALVRASRSLLGITPGVLESLAPMLLTIVVALAPLCLLVGRQFALGARLLGGSAYVAEGIGAVAGGALFSFFLVRWLDPLQIALLVAAANLAVAALLARQRTLTILTVLLTVGTVALLAGALPLGSWLHHATLDWQYTGLRFARDSIYGRTAITGSGEQRVFFENGLLFFETQGATAEEIAHLPLLAHPDPRRMLLIGGGVRGTLTEALRHPSVEAVYYVELDPQVIAAARSQLPPDQAAALDDPRVTIINQDGRAWVHSLGREQVPGSEPFDVIILDLPEPATGQLNRFYTQEFFAEVRAILSPGGVFALGLPWQENYANPPLQRLAASIYHTLASKFPEIALLPGERLFLLASDSPLPADPTVFSTRLTQRHLDTRWVVPSYLNYLLTTDRIAQARQMLETATDVRVNHDLEPVSYLYGLSVWLSRLYGGPGRLEARPWQLAWLAVPLLAAAILHLRRPMHPRIAVAVAIGLAGLSGMVLEVVMLLAFQVVHGYVYRQVGVIVTAFMAGLALGSAVANRPQWSRREFNRWDLGPSPRMALVWIQGGLALFALCFPPAMALQPPAWAFAGLALLAGTLGGLAFSLAVICLQAEPAVGAGRATGLLYGADLAGGCVGALLASTLLVPILGISYTCLGVTVVESTGLLLLIRRR
jgi:spermidine synthase